jgi:hypothetical protein
MRVSARAIVIGTALLAVGVLAVGGTPRRAGRAVGKGDTGASAQPDPRAAIFIQRGCAECHAIAALGVKAATDVGPDLTFAYADVVNRYGVNLDWFLDNPSGVMGLVFVSHVRLTRLDRDSMSHTLEALYHERLADMDENIPSFPPASFRPRARSER